MTVANLETDCAEIVEDQGVTPEELAAMGETGMVSNNQDEEEEDVVDPDDPLYGLDQRLSELTINEESKRIIREKLIAASNKIKTGLESRQTDLDAKIAS